MKRTLLILFACAGLFITACTDKDHTNDVNNPDEKTLTQIVLNRHTMTMIIGTTDSLEVTGNDGIAGIYQWQSSDKEIAVVDTLGHVNAVGLGTATIVVTETKTNLTDTCLVTVVTELEAIEFTHAYIFNTYATPEYLASLDTIDSVFVYTDDNGVRHPLRAFLVDVTVEIYSDGLYLDEKYNYAGAPVGYVAYFPSKAYYAPAGMNTDRGFAGSASISTGVWSTQLKTVSHRLVEGKMENEADAIEQIKTAVGYFNEQNYSEFSNGMITACNMAFTGGRIYRYEAYETSSGERGYSRHFIPDAIPTACAVKIEYGDEGVMYNIGAMEMYMTPILGDLGWGVWVTASDYDADNGTYKYNVIGDRFVLGDPLHYKRNTNNAPARRMQDRAIPLTQEDLNAPILPAPQPKNVRIR